jgi:hypothetical protein
MGAHLPPFLSLPKVTLTLHLSGLQQLCRGGQIYWSHKIELAPSNYMGFYGIMPLASPEGGLAQVGC